MKVNISDGLFHQAEINHQRGFLYIIGKWDVADRCYAQAIQYKERLYGLGETPSYETSIAQALVNWGAVKEGFLQIAEQVKHHFRSEGRDGESGRDGC